MQEPASSDPGSCPGKEWTLKPSQIQFWLDAAVLLVPFYLLWRIVLYPHIVYLVALSGVWATLVFLMRYVRWPDHNLTRIGFDSEGWWIERSGSRQSITFHNHSIKRDNLVMVRWSRFPWHAIALRKENFDSADEFRRFRASLYGEW